jgi:hypothetical protein
MTLPQTNITISNIDPDSGAMHITKLRAVLDGPIRKSVGSSGDSVSLSVEASEWPANYAIDGEFHININQGETGNELVLKGYKLMIKMPVSMGNDLDDPDGTPTPRQYRILLETRIRGLRDGLGGLLNEGTLNELDTEGGVDINHADYKSNQELVDMCLDAMGLEHEAAPLSLDQGADGSTIFAPGPLDWGNARPLNELEAILSRLGWTVVQLNDGKVAVRRLLRAGEAINIPAPILAAAEPYTLQSMPGVRGSKMLVTSGATRSTIITTRQLPDSKSPTGTGLEWVTFNPAINEWEVQSATAIDDYKAGITAGDLSPEASKQLGQLFRALRLNASELSKTNIFVNIPTAIDFGDLAAFAGGPGVVEAACCIKMAGDQLVNVPTLTGTKTRIDGLRAISGQGVFVLPTDAEYVRVDGFDTGRKGDVRELGHDDLILTFAHEANTGVFTDDYFVVGFEWDHSTGSPVISTMTHEQVLVALDDASVVKVGAPMLRRVMSWDDAAASPIMVSHNSTELTAIAKQIAVAKMADSSVESGAIVLRGIVDINPGDIDGAVTTVAWNPTQNITIITINQHEVPRSHYEKLQRASGNSIASGIGSMRLSRSSAALGDLRNTLTAGTDTPRIEGTATPESNPQQRGRTRSMAGVKGVQDGGVRTRVDLPTVAEQTSIFVQITASTLIGAAGSNIWEYDWSEVRFDAGIPSIVGATRTSTTHGKARNTMEMLNTGSGVEANGIDVDALTGTFEMQPISDLAIVELRGPFPPIATPLWYFASTNAIDGECAS